MAISYNKVVLIGRLTRDPEIRSTPSGTKVANFSLAIDRGKNQSTGENETDFIRIVAFNKLADFASSYLQKGRLILVEGSLRIQKWTDKNEQKREQAEIWASSMNFMESKKSQDDGRTYPDPGEFDIKVEPGQKKKHYPNSESDEKGLGDVPMPDFDDNNEFDSIFQNLKSDLSSDNLPKI